MRLALKLLSSLALATIVLLGLTAFAEHWRRDELIAMDVEAEGRMARALRAVVVKVCEISGPSAAKEVIDTLNTATPQREVRWLTLDEVPSIPGRDLKKELAARMESGEPVWAQWPNEDGEWIRYFYIPVAEGGKPVGVIEASESMAPRTEFLKRERVQTAAVGFLVLGLSGALAAVLGRRMIAHPIAALRQSMRALGDGEFVPPAIGSRHDELGSLAIELSAVGQRIAERERMRHDDRLRTVGQLASGVAHELGTPLSVVAVRARLIASGEATGDEAVANAKAILEQSERMTRLVRQLLDYSRRGGTTPEDVDLRQTTLQMIEMLEPLARSHGVSLVAAADPGDVHVRGDAAQLKQVLTNLVMNGIQAMPAGGRVEIRTGRGPASAKERLARSTERVQVSVTDDGPGIAADDLPHVFDPFFTTKPAGEGTGLGLAVAQAIVEEHGGTIAVQSKPGQGATFAISLPARADELERLAS